jgi:hypothetical protein
MDPIVTTVLTILLSAFVGSLTALFVERTKVRFRLRTEHEYQILMKLWEKAYLVKSRANSLRPLADTIDPNESPEDRKARRLQALEDSMIEFEKEIYLNKPFYPEKIHEMLRQLRIEANMEGIEYAETSPYPRDYHYLAKYWDNAIENSKKIDALTNQLCDAIRRHVHGRRIWGWR